MLPLIGPPLDLDTLFEANCAREMALEAFAPHLFMRFPPLLKLFYSPPLGAPADSQPLRVPRCPQLPGGMGETAFTVAQAVGEAGEGSGRDFEGAFGSANCRGSFKGSSSEDLDITIC